MVEISSLNIIRSYDACTRSFYAIRYLLLNLNDQIRGFNSLVANSITIVKLNLVLDFTG